MDFNDLINSISKLKNIELPAEASQFKMSPPFRRELIARNKSKIKTAKQAAVLALLYPDLNQIVHIALILRKTYHGVHSAQIGFPGGKVEVGDEDLVATALRETNEEIGVHAEMVEVIKPLTPVYIPPSNFFVKPFFGISRSTPTFVRQDDEVEDIVEVPLTQLLDDQLVISTTVPTSYNISVKVPAFDLNGHIVWGATAMMLSEIKDLLKEVR
ncbi:MAG: CoA pyrophosphatase [Flavobacteriaceae bacterium]|nr:CoA pyrophosphatase [Bacteroidia bacterium]MBT8288031.1 CoA pyrophosphatase [Bacteroidia bacterium]NNF75863.1 CoA pyrophosphatase [Flavobacteriaceae bacterium]NNK73088.1 CoA pyrophosphatase [Flavobacteriaceae bacterium]